MAQTTVTAIHGTIRILWENFGVEVAVARWISTRVAAVADIQH